MTIREQFDIFARSKFFRVLLHIGFWFLFLSLPLYHNFTLGTFSANWVLLITIINIFFVALYYPFAYFVIPRFLKPPKMHFFILFTIALYALLFYFARGLEKYALAHYSFNETDKLQLIPDSKREIYFFPAILQTIVVTAIPLSLKFLRSFYRLQDERNSLAKMNTQLELDFLKSQVNPHFLFNSLNNIYSLALVKSDKAPEMIIKLSDLMRYMLYDCNVEKNELSKEFDFMRDYIDLEKIRHGKDVEITYITEGDIQGKKLPPLLLIPFIENAFKHGVNAQLGKSWVRFVISVKGNSLHFTSENNKPFNGRIINKAQSGIGIENTIKRLQLIYPAKHSLLINEDNSIYTVTLNIEDVS